MSVILKVDTGDDLGLVYLHMQWSSGPLAMWPMNIDNGITVLTYPFFTVIPVLASFIDLKLSQESGSSHDIKNEFHLTTFLVCNILERQMVTSCYLSLMPTLWHTCTVTGTKELRNIRESTCP